MITRSLVLILFVSWAVTSTARSRQNAEQVYVLTRPEHTMEQVETAYAAIPPVTVLSPLGDGAA
jgi:hypothetical protein